MIDKIIKAGINYHEVGLFSNTEYAEELFRILNEGVNKAFDEGFNYVNEIYNEVYVFDLEDGKRLDRFKKQLIYKIVHDAKYKIVR